jgi:hypothetical protein
MYQARMPVSVWTIGFLFDERAKTSKHLPPERLVLAGARIVWLAALHLRNDPRCPDNIFKCEHVE